MTTHLLSTNDDAATRCDLWADGIGSSCAFTDRWGCGHSASRHATGDSMFGRVEICMECQEGPSDGHHAYAPSDRVIDLADLVAEDREAAVLSIDCPPCRETEEQEPGDGGGESPSYRQHMQDAGRGGLLR